MKKRQKKKLRTKQSKSNRDVSYIHDTAGGEMPDVGGETTNLFAKEEVKKRSA